MRPTEFIPDTETRTISIHAPRERCDILLGFHHIERSWNFNPRTAWAMRHILKGILCGFNPFQSTHRVSDATNLYMALYQLYEISIHAPRERCDATNADVAIVTLHFNPRTAWAMRLWTKRFRSNDENFNPRTAWAMRRYPLSLPCRYQNISIHAPRERCDYS